MKKRYLFSIVLALTTIVNTTVFGQIQVTNTMTVKQLVENVLIGSGVTAQNIKVNGQATLANTVQVNASYYNQNNTPFPISNGVLLTTGQGNIAVGPNNSASASNSSGTNQINDSDLDAIASGAIKNGITIEFDFMATGNLLEFKYLFGSEEYPEFSPSSFNDVFGFFLSGPGLSGPYSNGAVNIAQLPTTPPLPVTINNVNPSTNAAYYKNNAGGAAWGNSIQYDGTTIVLTARSEIVCGQMYHIKLGIANVGDQSWDSGVFLEGGSFTTNPIDFTFQTNTNDNTILEGCNQFGKLVFTRSGCGTDNDTLVGLVTFSGTATNGVDYALLPNTVTLLPGVNEVIWFIESFEDYIVEGIETIDIEVKTFIPLTGDTIVSNGQFFINDRPEIIFTPNHGTSYCWTNTTPISANPTGGIQPYHYAWNTGDTTQTINVVSDVNGVKEYEVTVTDDCGYTKTTTVTLTTNQTLHIDSFIVTPATCQPVGSVSTMSFPYGAHLQNPSNPNSYNLTFNWTYGPAHTGGFPNQSALGDLPAGWYYLELTDNVIHCTVKDSALVEAINVPSAVIQANPGTGCSPLDVTLTNNSQNANSFQWDLGNGTFGGATSNTDPIHQTYSETSVIRLIASNGDAACNDTTAVTVTIVTCGCTDPAATNYNPNAVMNDGSCVYPTPTVEAPNVITINNDGVNEYFFLKTTYAESIELVIVNRWGNKVFEGHGDQNNTPQWDGKDASGKLISEGVYFYTYKVTGVLGDELIGHGFLTVVR